MKEGPTLILANPGDTTGTIENNPQWHPKAAYTGGNVVFYESVCYRAKWWTRDQIPTSEGSPWEVVDCGESETIIDPNEQILVEESNDGGSGTGSGDSGSGGGSTFPPDSIPVWDEAGQYMELSVVQYEGICYKANWWAQGIVPVPRSELANIWDSPWEDLSTCPDQHIVAPSPSSESGVGGGGAIDKMPMPIVVVDDEDDDAVMEVTKEAGENTDNLVTPVIPPVVPMPIVGAPERAPTPPAELPAEGYEFLRMVTTEDWDWLFPLRSGKYVSATDGGATRNLPPIANEDGSTDTFTLDAFVEATLAYNSWAAANGYKQFLNEGTLKQQAEEFLVFWAKSARETSGSWKNAPFPWRETYTFGGEEIVAWRGALYWVEEAAYAGSTDPETGRSMLLNYIDAGSTEFPPAPGRSYYGRGIIQLSWNYNYGAFSYWLHDNGLLSDIITERDILLRFPNLVADYGELSILSGIWFWMTPQGAKPASQDVILGAVTNISQASQDLGLPQTRGPKGETPYVPKVAEGETSDPEVFAYRLGTVINIVNGGLECNGAAKWHDGPRHRVSYYNAYAAYFNDKYGVDATRMPEATNVWDVQPTFDSHITHQSGTCYNQRAYYGW